MAAGTRSTNAHRTTIGSLTAMACAAALLTGCGSGAINGPDAGGNGQGATAANGDRGGGKDGGGRGHHYGFGLPEGPTSGEPYGSIYEAIRRGDCDTAQGVLRNLTDGSDTLSRAGIALCRDHQSTAGKILRGYRPQAGLFTDQNLWYRCELYRAAMSVVHQRPRSHYGTCPPPPPKASESSPAPEPSTPTETATPDSSMTPSVSESPVAPSGQSSPEASE